MRTRPAQSAPSRARTRRVSQEWFLDLGPPSPQNHLVGRVGGVTGHMEGTASQGGDGFFKATWLAGLVTGGAAVCPTCLTLGPDPRWGLPWTLQSLWGGQEARALLQRPPDATRGGPARHGPLVDALLPSRPPKLFSWRPGGPFSVPSLSLLGDGHSSPGSAHAVSRRRAGPAASLCPAGWLRATQKTSRAPSPAICSGTWDLQRDERDPGNRTGPHASAPAPTHSRGLSSSYPDLIPAPESPHLF